MPSATVGESATNGADRWTIALFALIGLGLGLALFATLTPTYQAAAVIDIANPSQSLDREIAEVTSPAVIDVAESLVGFRPDVTVTAAEVTNRLTITATSDDATNAAAAANAVASTFVQGQPGAAATLAAVAEVPANATGPGAGIFALLGATVGALAGFLVTVVLRSRSASPTPTPLARGAPRPSSTRSSTPSPAPDLAQPAEAPPTMTSKPSSFSDAAIGSAPRGPTWLEGSSTQLETDQVSDLDRRALQSKIDTERNELVLAHSQELSRVASQHQEASAGLQAEVASLRKQVRLQTVRLRNRSGEDQTRTGDLEAQVDALEVELADLRRTLENERIAHTRRLTEDQGTADRALDNARREYREELAKHVHGHRQTIADYRSDLDTELADRRARHAAALEEQHHEYERQLEAERARVDAKLDAATKRNEVEMETLRGMHRQELDRQAAQHKTTITNLRATGENTDSQQRELEKENRALRVELSMVQKQLRQSVAEHETDAQRTKDELILIKGELDGERQRSAALRADVLRRSAESHQAVDRAVEERTAQLSELEASVARQREYADTRVREVSASAEEQARQAATREAGLTSTVSRLKRELEEAKRAE